MWPSAQMVAGPSSPIAAATRCRSSTSRRVEVERTLAVGDEPHGVLTNRSGSLLFVLNTASENVSVIDTETWAELRRLPASRSPWSLA